MFLFIKSMTSETLKRCNFNTSHVLIHHSSRVFHSARTQISIHLMFLFIKAQKRLLIQVMNFNTSHVLIHQRKHFSVQAMMKISIHLMFLFINSDISTIMEICDNFNTSHVLIHQSSQGSTTGAQLLFQYISCSYSSTSRWFEEAKKQQFQYISCSYSSKTQKKCIRRKSDFNTSHVLIHRAAAERERAAVPEFQYISCSYSSRRITSDGKDKERFQYISCSYSSRSFGVATPKCFISIHLMFLFIKVYKRFEGTKTQFQYISCSYSSKAAEDDLLDIRYFNTSHVLIHQYSRSS